MEDILWDPRQDPVLFAPDPLLSSGAERNSHLFLRFEDWGDNILCRF